MFRTIHLFLSQKTVLVLANSEDPGEIQCSMVLIWVFADNKPSIQSVLGSFARVKVVC